MASITIEHAMLRKLADISYKEAMELLPRLGAPCEPMSGEKLFIEITPNRPDLLGIEGVARLIKDYKSGKPREYKFPESAHVKVGVVKGRPFIAACAVKGVALDKNELELLIDFQEKLHETFGRKRRKVAIGIHDLDKLQLPITYNSHELDGIRFVALNETKEMTPRDVVNQIFRRANRPQAGRYEAHSKNSRGVNWHSPASEAGGNLPLRDKHAPTTGQRLVESIQLNKIGKGTGYGKIVEGYGKAPIITDARGKVISFPPIINAEMTRLTSGIRNMLVEVTGTSAVAVSQARDMIACALADRGAKVDLIGGNAKRKCQAFRVPVAEACKILNIRISKREAEACLARMGYIVRGGKAIVPIYRTDILGTIDLVEDIAIAYDYNKIAFTLPSFISSGKKEDEPAHETMIGLGFTEVMTFTLNANEENELHIANAKTIDTSRFRNSLMQQHLQVLFSNKDEKLPIKVYEVGIVYSGGGERRTLGFGKYSPNANFSMIKGNAERVLKELWPSRKYEFAEADDKRYIPGRCVSIKAGGKLIGHCGEVALELIERFRLEQPVAYCEIEM
ncbi:hypothetical protein COT30_03610 [Candidatus Micrarchaeota archaeon CG08_land_8_20_14_0_20_49_17]|nr:MAG: hypothetical protein COT30_03610 [Candidatus Micrarchaeota archaeon CG08_land_8_20_14_0_20_49_17]